MADRGIAFYERGLARLEDRWAGGGEQGERFRDDNHVYSNDLDLFGRGSLFELLSLARTRTGEETLARWLKSPADAAEIHARQAASDELSSALDLRERFALAGASVRASVHTDRLLEWAQVRIPVDSGLRALTWVLTGAVLLAIAYAAFAGTWWSLGTIAAVQVSGLRAGARAYRTPSFRQAIRERRLISLRMSCQIGRRTSRWSPTCSSNWRSSRSRARGLRHCAAASLPADSRRHASSGDCNDCPRFMTRKRMRRSFR